MTLTLQRNRYLLAGLLAFIVLVATQVSVQAYNFGGGWRSVQLVGTAGVNSWQLVGDALVDSDLNAAEMPIVSTVSPTNLGATATLQGNTTSMGAAASISRYFEWYQTSGPVFTTPLATGTTTGTYSDTITFDPLKTLNVRAVNQVGSVKTYGSWMTLEVGSIVTGGNLIWQIIPLVVAAVVIIMILVLSMSKWTATILLTGVISGILAYVVTYMLIRIFFG